MDLQRLIRLETLGLQTDGNPELAVDLQGLPQTVQRLDIHTGGVRISRWPSASSLANVQMYALGQLTLADAPRGQLAGCHLDLTTNHLNITACEQSHIQHAERDVTDALLCWVRDSRADMVVVNPFTDDLAPFVLTFEQHGSVVCRGDFAVENDLLLKTMQQRCRSYGLKCNAMCPRDNVCITRL